MQLSVMVSAEWHDKFVTDLPTECPRLREPEVVRITRRALADETRLRCNEPQVSLVASPAWPVRSNGCSLGVVNLYGRHTFRRGAGKSRWLRLWQSAASFHAVSGNLGNLDAQRCQISAFKRACVFRRKGVFGGQSAVSPLREFFLFPETADFGDQLVAQRRRRCRGQDRLANRTVRRFAASLSSGFGWRPDWFDRKIRRIEVVLAGYPDQGSIRPRYGRAGR